MNLQRQSYFSVSSEGVPIRNIADYSPFGVQLDGRTISGDFYRYGYQGSEKDDESKGDGNSYTTEFRQLDPRVGRWFTIDPVFKPQLSPFISMTNNPIIRIDPKGDDDYFNSKGQFVRSDNKDTRNVFIENANGVQKRIDKVNFSSKNAWVLSKIAKYYAKEAGISIGDLSGGCISIADSRSTILDGQLIFENKSLFNNGSTDDDDIANYNPINNTLSLSLKNGKLNSLLRDGNNIKNLIVHEKAHKENDETNVYEHLSVYLKQVSDKSWKNTTDDWKTHVTNNINELIKKVDNSDQSNWSESQKNYTKKLKKEFKSKGVDL